MHPVLERCVADPEFIARHPHYVGILALLDPVADPSVAVMAVSRAGDRFRLAVNTAYFEEHPELLQGVLHHEVRHIALSHLTERKLQVADLNMMIAKECSANELIVEPLPDRIVRWQDYEHLGLGPGQSTLERYRLLESARQAGRPIPIHPDAWLDELPRIGPGRGAIISMPGFAWIRPALGAFETTWPALVGPQAFPARDPLTRPVPDPTENAMPSALPAVQAFAFRLRGTVYTYAYPNRRFPGRVGEVPGRRRRPPAGRGFLPQSTLREA